MMVSKKKKKKAVKWGPDGTGVDKYTTSTDWDGRNGQRKEDGSWVGYDNVENCFEIKNKL